MDGESGIDTESDFAPIDDVLTELLSIPGINRWAESDAPLADADRMITGDAARASAREALDRADSDGTQEPRT